MARTMAIGRSKWDILKNQLNIQQAHYLRMKNYLIDLAMIDAKYAILPTNFQAKAFQKDTKER